ncbi:MAG: SDR family NAD(P)-dependent oxidoreductase [Planctomycetota bacterium]|jgi:NADH dehydrogenase
MEDPPSNPVEREAAPSTDPAPIQSVLITGATGFVGRYVVQEITRRGLRAVCLVRSQERLLHQHPHAVHDLLSAVQGDLADSTALREAAARADAAIHLVGIIINRRLQGKTFEKVHVTGTSNVVQAVTDAGMSRYAHMSALGTRAEAVSEYHQTKWRAEELVRQSGLDWTIFRPSLIHGHDGEFMQLMRAFVCGLVPPVIPYFGGGKARLQPVAVQDVAYAMVESLFRAELVGKIIPMGGPHSYSWKELYETCRRLIPGASRTKPMVSLPVPVARMAALLASPPLAVPEMLPGLRGLGKFRFDRGQVTMAQENSTCDAGIAQDALGFTLRDFEVELSEYAGRIR